jgi:hypothetical protein
VKIIKLADIEIHCLLRVYYAAQAMRNLSSRQSKTMREWVCILAVLAVAIGWDIRSFNGRATSYAISMASNAIPYHR